MNFYERKDVIMKGLFGIYLFLAITAAALSFDAMARSSEPKELAVTVTGIYCSVALVTTEEGTTRSVMVDEVKREAVPWIEKGDRIMIEVDKADQVVEIRPMHEHRGIRSVVGHFLRQLKAKNA